MGRRAINQTDILHSTPITNGLKTIRKRKQKSVLNNSSAVAKALRLNPPTNCTTIINQTPNNFFQLKHETEDDNNVFSSASSNEQKITPISHHKQSTSSKHANHSSILFNTSSSLRDTGAGDCESIKNESPKPVYTLRPSIVNGTILRDIHRKPWRLGRPIGKGNFGEIFLASDNINVPVINENANFVVKIEPHSNGPLFVEIHCLLNTARNNSKTTDPAKVEEVNDKNYLEADDEPQPQTPPNGIPEYIASGSHYFGGSRYRFLVLQRFDRDLHSLIRNSCVSQKSLLALAVNIINVLESLHDKGYCHNDVKAQNLMISKCKYYKKVTTTTTTTTASTNNNSNKTKKITLKNNTKTTKRTTTKYDYEEKQQTTDSGNSSEQEQHDYYNDAYDNDDEDEDDDEHDNFSIKRNKIYNDNEHMEVDDDDDFEASSQSTNSNSMDAYQTPVNRNRKHNGRINKLIQYSGTNPVRSCRRPEKTNNIYDEMVKSHYLRPSKRVSYSEFFTEDGASMHSGDLQQQNGRSTTHDTTDDDDDSEEFLPHYKPRTAANARKTEKSRNSTKIKNNNNSINVTTTTANLSPVKRPLTRRQEKLLEQTKRQHQQQGIVVNLQQPQPPPASNRYDWIEVKEERIFLIDYGLASKFMDRGVHRPFIMDQRRAHDGTLEFTSRDAHMGAHSRRSDLECLGYNLIHWHLGYLPWKEAAALQQQEKVHRAKEYFMTDVREMLKEIYGKDVPRYLGDFLHLVGQLAYHERPDYVRYRRLFERAFVNLVDDIGNEHHKTSSTSFVDLRLDSMEIQRSCISIVKDERLENTNNSDIFECKKLNHNNSQVISIMRNLSMVSTPFQDRSISNRVSPKNLRSKSDKNTTKKKKFCWADILSQDPDQIARKRAEEEFAREEDLTCMNSPRRYEGNPTYAILKVLSRNMQVDSEEGDNDDEVNEEIRDDDDEIEAEEEENDEEYVAEEEGNFEEESNINEDEAGNLIGEEEISEEDDNDEDYADDDEVDNDDEDDDDNDEDDEDDDEDEDEGDNKESQIGRVGIFNEDENMSSSCSESISTTVREPQRRRGRPKKNTNLLTNGENVNTNNGKSNNGRNEAITNNNNASVIGLTRINSSRRYHGGGRNKNALLQETTKAAASAAGETHQGRQQQHSMTTTATKYLTNGVKDNQTKIVSHHHQLNSANCVENVPTRRRRVTRRCLYKSPPDPQDLDYQQKQHRHQNNHNDNNNPKIVRPVFLLMKKLNDENMYTIQGSGGRGNDRGDTDSRRTTKERGGHARATAIAGGAAGTRNHYRRY